MRFSLTTILLLVLATAPGMGQCRDSIRRVTLSVPERTGGTQSVRPLHRDVSPGPPKGYRAFAVSHYGRHGSRYAPNPAVYQRLHDVLEGAAANGNLTPAGDSLRRMYGKVFPLLRNHSGDLTFKGRAQHMQIAADMVEDYPGVFVRDAAIEAIATTSPRCVMSMASFTEELVRRRPSLAIRSSASATYLPMLNPYSKDNPELDAECLRILDGQTWMRSWEQYRSELFIAPEFASRFFKRPADIRDFCSPMRFAMDLYFVSGLSSSMDFEGSDFSGFFTADELCSLWEAENIIFYMDEGPGLEGNRRQPLLMWHLLEDFLDGAEAAIASDKPSVKLRFGHDMPLMGLLSLMGLPEWSGCARDWPDVACVWQNWRIPMASHLEMVLYRSRRNPEVLVKVLLNNEPLTLPLEASSGPYYRWTDFCGHYRSVIAEARNNLAKPACNRLFHITNRIDGHSMQAFSISGETAYVVNDGGLCRTWSMKTCRQTGSFMLGCAHPTLHGGNVNFGPDGLMYVSGDLTTKACYVEKVYPTGSQWVQTITFSLDNGYGGSQAVLDTARSRIVYMQREDLDIKAPDNRFHIYEFPLPPPYGGDVTFTEKDVLREYVLDRYEPIYQGACIFDGVLLLSHGVSPDRDGISTGGTGYDLDPGKTVSLTALSTVMPSNCEPQSVCISEGKVYMNFNRMGLYQVVLSDILPE